MDGKKAYDDVIDFLRLKNIEVDEDSVDQNTLSFHRKVKKKYLTTYYYLKE